MKRYKLRELIEKAGYKPYILGERLGFSYGIVYAWLNSSEPDCKTIIKLAKVLNCSVEEIVRIFAEGAN